MGLFDFVRDAGRKLGLGRGEEKEAAAEAEKATALKKLIVDLGLEVENLMVTFDDGVATVSGTASSREEAEKVVLALGNTQGVSQVDDRMTHEDPTPESVFYTVVPGDSLSKISLAHYGDAMKYMVIFEANKPMLTDPDLIYPGQVLRIPALGD